MQLGPYRLLERIGQGGMGEVWKAEDTNLLRIVAVKLLKEEMAGDAEWKARFLREARTAARLSHPNIATIFAVDEAEKRMYIAMEYVEGDSLKKLIAAKVLTMPDVVRILKRCADALAEAHAHGIIHRDVKPENVVVTKRGVKMLDFGIAKLIDAPPEDAGKLTSDGTVIGTPDYMSPEQALGKTIDARSDLFALGVVLYEALTGHHPFATTSVTETLVNIVTREPIDIARLLPSAPPQLVEIVQKATRKKPEERYETAKQMASALNKIYRRIRRRCSRWCRATRRRCRSCRRGSHRRLRPSRRSRSRQRAADGSGRSAPMRACSSPTTIPRCASSSAPRWRSTGSSTTRRPTAPRPSSN